MPLWKLSPRSLSGSWSTLGQLWSETSDWIRRTNLSAFSSSQCLTVGRAEHALQCDAILPPQRSLDWIDDNSTHRLYSIRHLLCSFSGWATPQPGNKQPTLQGLMEQTFKSRCFWLLGPALFLPRCCNKKFRWSELYFLLCAKELYILSTPAVILPHSPPKK